MKLVSARLTEFKSIWDTGRFELGQVTCLVGKNEAGKTAVLQALYRLNPINENDGKFEVTDDYPRSDVENYQQDIETKARPVANVVEAGFELEESELEAIAETYGPSALSSKVVTLTKGYKHERNTYDVKVPVDEAGIVKFLVARSELGADVKAEAESQATLRQLAAFLSTRAKQNDAAVAAATAKANQLADEAEKAAAVAQANQLAEPAAATAFRQQVAEFQKAPTIGQQIWETVLKQHLPKFLYFDEYYQLTGHDNVQKLKARKEANKLQESDYPLLGLIELARLDLDKLLASDRTQDLKNKLEGASNFLSKQILKYWSQNRHLRMRFDVRPAMPRDPENMRDGTNIWGEIHDSKHQVSTGLGTRSRGFVWFFSFLAWYSSVKKKNEPLVLLLDEPGTSLHGKAQEDLLRYFEEEVVPNKKHQLIYTTHSPFMVDPFRDRWERVRIVQDKGIDSDVPPPREEDGTKVFTDVLEAGSDSLFPLQAALGYEIYQALFVGPNSLVVEGVSDLLYLQTISSLLEVAGRTGLDHRWTTTPVGGSDRVPTFVSLLGSQKGMTVATLIDLQKKDQQPIENLYKKKLIKKSNVLTFADFSGKPEADIEDMFDEDFYLHLVNEEFADVLNKPLTPADVAGHAPRILVRLEAYFAANPLKGTAKFGHYRPARRMAERISSYQLSAGTLDRFEAAFRALNALLP